MLNIQMNRALKLFILSGIMLLWNCSPVEGRRKPRQMYKIDPELFRPGMTSEKPMPNGQSACACDMTYGQCDAGCCCDLDCNAKVVKIWEKDYKKYCAKNYIFQQNKPPTQCIKKSLIFRMNDRAGIVKKDVDDKYCFELDTGGVFSVFMKQRELKSSEYINAVHYPDLTKIITQQETFNKA